MLPVKSRHFSWPSVLWPLAESERDETKPFMSMLRCFVISAQSGSASWLSIWESLADSWILSWLRLVLMITLSTIIQNPALYHNTMLMNTYTVTVYAKFDWSANDLISPNSILPSSCCYPSTGTSHLKCMAAKPIVWAYMMGRLWITGWITTPWTQQRHVGE